MLSSCQATEAYRQTQAAFSQGATLEVPNLLADTRSDLPGNFVYFDDLYRMNTPLPTHHPAQVYYAEALKRTKVALRAKKQLAKQGTLDNTYALQALSLWRLGKYEQARKVATTAIVLLEKSEGDEGDLRDLAMMRALPGLINIDESLIALEKIKALGAAFEASTKEEERLAKYEQIKALFTTYYLSDTTDIQALKTGLLTIENVIDQLPTRNAISLYLRNAQLMGLDNWSGAFLVVFRSARRLENGSREMPWMMEVREVFKERVQQSLAGLENSLPNGKKNKLYQYWIRVLSTEG